MTPKQLNTKAKIETVAALFGIDPKWAVAVAMTESSLGENQVSPTGCSGVFQMSQIAMKDLLLQMRAMDDDLIDIVCGVAFLRERDSSFLRSEGPEFLSGKGKAVHGGTLTCGASWASSCLRLCFRWD